MYATGGAITVLAMNGVTGGVNSGFNMSGHGTTDVLSAFSYAIRNLVPCKMRVLLTTNLTGLDPVSVLPCLCCPLTVNVTTLFSVLFHCPGQCD